MFTFLVPIYTFSASKTPLKDNRRNPNRSRKPKISFRNPIHANITAPKLLKAMSTAFRRSIRPIIHQRPHLNGLRSISTSPFFPMGPTIHSQSTSQPQSPSTQPSRAWSPTPYVTETIVLYIFPYIFPYIHSRGHSTLPALTPHFTVSPQPPTNNPRPAAGTRKTSTHAS